MYDAELVTVEVHPRGGDLPAFSFAKPANWQLLPQCGSGSGASLATAVAPHGEAVLTVEVRPGGQHVCLRDWIRADCRDRNIQIDNLSKFQAGATPGFICHARQTCDALTVRIRAVFVEDAGRLLVTAAMAAEPIFERDEFVLTTLAESFRFTSPVGPTVPLLPVPAVAYRSSLGLTFSVPFGWTAAEEGAVTVISQASSGSCLRVGLLAHDPAIFQKLHSCYSRTNPEADPMFQQVGDEAILALANLRLPDAASMYFRAYFVRSRPQEGRMYIAQVTMPQGSFHAAMTIAANVLAALPV